MKNTVEETSIEHDYETIDRLRPEYVTFGGLWIDALLATKRYDILQMITETFIHRVRAMGVQELLYTYMAHLLPSIELAHSDLFSGAFVPSNLLGQGCIKEDSLVQFAKYIGYSLGLHCLCLGAVPLDKAILYAKYNKQLNEVVIGTSKESNILDLANALNL